MIIRWPARLGNDTNSVTTDNTNNNKSLSSQLPNATYPTKPRKYANNNNITLTTTTTLLYRHVIQTNWMI